MHRLSCKASLLCGRDDGIVHSLSTCDEVKSRPCIERELKQIDDWLVSYNWHTAYS